MALKTLQKVDIFISSPSDVSDERQRAIRVIDRLNRMQNIAPHYVLKPLTYEQVVPAVVGDTPQTTVNKYMMEASSADLFICILWSRLGTPILDGQTGQRYQSGTEYEFLSAYHAHEQTGKPYILLYRGMKAIQTDANLEQASAVQEFFKRFEGDRAEFKGLYKTYRTLDEFEETLFHDLDAVLTRNLFSTNSEGPTYASGAPKPIRCDFYQHIPTPANYVARADLLAEVRAALLADAPNVALTSAIKGGPTALHGLGGIGKSVIARALCDDPQVQAAFPDGILWTTLGQEPNLATKLREWISALGGTVTETAPSEDSLRANLAHLLEGQACLLIVDDAWQKKHVETFRVGGHRCRLLITTRDAELARGLGARVQSVPTMTISESIQLLEEWSDGRLAGENAGIKTQIANRLGRLPLALKLAGAQLQRKTPEEWLRTFDARKLKSRRPEDIHDSLEQTFGLSLDALQASERHLYATLVIFRQDEPIHEAGIRRLWNALSDLSDDLTGEFLDDLAARALLEVVRTTYPRAVVLHDLLRDFVEAELGEDREKIHRTLLDAYRKSETSKGWYTAPDDGYLYDHLTYHLKSIRATDELKALFADQSWMNVRVPQCGYDYEGYLNDLQIAWDAADAEAHRQIDSGASLPSFGDCARLALIRTSLNSIAGNHIPELVARAVELNLWTPARALSMASRVPTAAAKVQMYVALLSQDLVPGAERLKAQKAALSAALTIANGADRAASLKLLASCQDENMRAETLHLGLTAARSIDDTFYQAVALTAFIPYLDNEQRTAVIVEGLKAALAPWQEWQRARVLASISPYLADRQWDKLLSFDNEEAHHRAHTLLAPFLPKQESRQDLDAALSITNNRDRAEALAALIPHLSEKMGAEALEQGLKAAQAILNERSRSRVLASLAAYLGAESASDLLDIAQSIRDERSRVWTLTALLPRLPVDQVQRALDIILPIQDEESRAQCLVSLAPLLQDQQIQHVLALALGLGNDANRAHVLAALAPLLSVEQAQQVLNAGLTLTDESSRVKALSTLASHLNDQPRYRALHYGLEAVAAIAGERSRSWAVAALAPYLERPLMKRAVEMVYQFQDPGIRAWTISILMQHLPDSLRAEAVEHGLEAAQTIKQAESYVDTVSVLASFLPESRQKEVFAHGVEVALSVTDSENRARSLLAIIPHLEGQQRENALDQALRDSQTIRHRDARIWALVGLMPYLEGSQLAKAAAQSLTAGLIKGNEIDRSLVLSALVPYLKLDQITQVITAAQAMKNRLASVRLLATVLARLPDDRRAELLAYSVDIAFAITDEHDRALALAELLPLVPDQVGLLRSIQHALVERLHAIENEKRLGFLEFCAERVLLTPPILGPDILASLAEHIIEICWNWRWV